MGKFASIFPEHISSNGSALRAALRREGDGTESRDSS